MDAGSRVLIIQQEQGFLSLVLLIDDVPYLVRTKPLPSDDWAVVERELKLTMSFLEERMEIEKPLPVRLSVESAVLAGRLRTWVELADGVSPATAPPNQPSFVGTTVVDRVGNHRLDPVVNVMSGGIR